MLLHLRNASSCVRRNSNRSTILRGAGLDIQVPRWAAEAKRTKRSLTRLEGTAWRFTCAHFRNQSAASRPAPPSAVIMEPTCCTALQVRTTGAVFSAMRSVVVLQPPDRLR